MVWQSHYIIYFFEHMSSIGYWKERLGTSLGMRSGVLNQMLRHFLHDFAMMLRERRDLNGDVRYFVHNDSVWLNEKRTDLSEDEGEFLARIAAAFASLRIAANQRISNSMWLGIVLFTFLSQLVSDCEIQSHHIAQLLHIEDLCLFDAILVYATLNCQPYLLIPSSSDSSE